jgi:hypothetical protein
MPFITEDHILSAFLSFLSKKYMHIINKLSDIPPRNVKSNAAITNCLSNGYCLWR